MNLWDKNHDRPTKLQVGDALNYEIDNGTIRIDRPTGDPIFFESEFGLRDNKLGIGLLDGPKAVWEIARLLAATHGFDVEQPEVRSSNVIVRFKKASRF